MNENEINCNDEFEIDNMIKSILNLYKKCSNYILLVNDITNKYNDLCEKYEDLNNKYNDLLNEKLKNPLSKIPIKNILQSNNNYKRSSTPNIIKKNSFDISKNIKASQIKK